MLVYIVIALVALIGICSLAVDFGRVQVAKSQLRHAADAAARAGAAGLATSATQARTNAIAIAAANSVDGSALTLSTSDIDVGNWSGSTFTLNGTPSNAVRVNASRTGNNGIPLLLAQVIGRSRCDVNASAVCKFTSTSVSGFIGFSSITTKNNAFIGSYNSASNTNPTHSTALASAAIGSNGAIDGKNNGVLNGTVILGPSATVTGFSITGSTTTRTTAISKPTDPNWSPSTNPGGISQNYTVNSNTTLLGGTYWFTSLTVNANLYFSGPATLYVNGNIVVNGALQPNSLIPSDLTIYQLGTGRSFGDSSSNSMDIVAVVSAPGTAFVAKNNFSFRGSAMFDSIEAKNNADMYYDEAQGPATGGTVMTLTK